MAQGPINLLPTAVSATLSVCLGQQVQLPAIILGTAGNNWLAAISSAGRLQLVLIPQATVCAASVTGPGVSGTLQPGALPIPVPSSLRLGG